MRYLLNYVGKLYVEGVFKGYRFRNPDFGWFLDISKEKYNSLFSEGVNIVCVAQNDKDSVYLSKENDYRPFIFKLIPYKGSYVSDDELRALEHDLLVERKINDVTLRMVSELSLKRYRRLNMICDNVFKSVRKTSELCGYPVLGFRREGENLFKGCLLFSIKFDEVNIKNMDAIKKYDKIGCAFYDKYKCHIYIDYSKGPWYSVEISFVD